MPATEGRRRVTPARRVRDLLRAQVLAGVYAGRALPPETDLARDLRVSRNVMRDALCLLREEGLIDRIPGAGTFVVSAKATQGLDRLRGLAESFDGGPGRVSNRVLLAEIVPAPAPVAERLLLESGALVVALERVRLLDDVPLSLDTSYLPADPGRRLLHLDLAGCDVFGLLEREVGVPLSGAALSVEAVAADAPVAAALEVPAGSPLLLLERLTFARDGRPLDLEFVRYRGDRISLTGLLPRDGRPTLAQLPTKSIDSIGNSERRT